jgi:hypothetical protein
VGWLAALNLVVVDSRSATGKKGEIIREFATREPEGTAHLQAGAVGLWTRRPAGQPAGPSVAQLAKALYGSGTMSLDPTLLGQLQHDPWFQARPAAWAIVKDGVQTIASTKPANFNLQCLLSNMCAYGSPRWSYEPGSRTNVENTLAGTHHVTDCSSLAQIFSEIANHLGYHTAPRKIERPGYRIVTKPGVVTFNGKAGDASLEGRWCFGDHWVVEYQNACYDPTFKFMGFPFASAASVYLGWYGQEKRDPGVFTGTFWDKDPTVVESRKVYMRMVPSVAYTFKKTDKTTGREL